MFPAHGLGDAAGGRWGQESAPKRPSRPKGEEAAGTGEEDSCELMKYLQGTFKRVGQLAEERTKDVSLMR